MDRRWQHMTVVAGRYAWWMAFLLCGYGGWLVWQASSRVGDVLGGVCIGVGAMLLLMGRLMVLLIAAEGYRQQQARKAREKGA